MLRVPLLLRFEGGSYDPHEEGGDDAGGVLFAQCNSTTTTRLPPLPLRPPPSCIVKLVAHVLTQDRSSIAARDHVRVCVQRQDEHGRVHGDADDAAQHAAVGWLEGA